MTSSTKKSLCLCFIAKVRERRGQSLMEFVRGALPDKNVFMMCWKLNPGARRSLPEAYHIRNCRKNGLAMWTAMPLDDPKEAEAYRG